MSTKRIEFTDEQIKEMIRLYVDERQSTRVLGEKFGCCKTTITRILKDNNVSIRNNTEGRRIIYKQEDINKVVDMWTNQCLTIQQIADFFNCSSTVIVRILKEQKIYKPQNTFYHFTKEEEGFIVNEYINNKKTIDEISRYFNCSSYPIRQVLLNYHVDTTQNKAIYYEGDCIGPYNTLLLARLKKEFWKNSYNLQEGIFECSFCAEHKLFQAPITNVACGQVISCGCKQKERSKGERLVKENLDKLNIQYIEQKTFEECYDNYLLRFDFYLPDYNCCIEYDGKQHFEPIEYFGGEEKFKDQQQKDNIKNEYCKNNNIKLIRIPYTDYSILNEIYLLNKIGINNERN